MKLRCCLALLVLATTPACGGDDEVAYDAAGGSDDAAAGPDAAPLADAVVPDAAPPDALVCAAPGFGEIGGPCNNDADCGGGFCLDETEGDGDGPSFPPEGYCTKSCTGDTDCGDGASCSNPLGGGGRLCFRDCCAGGACGSGYVCSSALFGLIDLGFDACFYGDPTATDGDPCDSVADCNANSMCQNNPFNAPGGVCITLGCTIGDDATCAAGGDATCLSLGGTPGCIDTCTIAADCRDDEGYDCIDFGGTGYCFYPTADVGDACSLATDCGPPPWECLTGPGFPGGYCGADGCDPTDPATCPRDSVCYDDDPGTLDGTEFCAKRCNPAGDDCRVGYACTDLGGGVSVCL